MRHHDVQDALQEGFEVAPLPPIGPEGAPVLTPIAPVPPPRPSLCQAGPCLHYHCFEIETEAEDPGSVKVPGELPPDTPRSHAVAGGTLYRAPRSFHVQTHHYCYPTSGVEMNLGSLPVLQCNRWHPIDNVASVHSHGSREADRQSFWVTDAGKAFTRAVRDWEAARAKDEAQDQEIQRLIAERLEQQIETSNETTDHTSQETPE